MKKSTAIIFLVLALGLVVLGILYGLAMGWDYSPANSYQTLLGVNASRVKEIRSDTGDFDLRIYDAWDDKLEVDGSGLAATRLSVTLSDGILTITAQELSPLARTFRRDGHDDYAVVWLPGEFSGTVTAVSTSGDLTLSGFVSPGSAAGLTTDSGDVSVYSSGLASVRLTSASGEVNIYDSAVGALEITTGSGDIWLNELKVGSADIVSDSGDIFGGLTASGGEDAVRVYSATGYVSTLR